ncbi:MAG: HAD hydrolase family protein [Bacteroidales bacterium]|jgi:3-deoxy-D-manno-octulosonate 8-phosphate phosphatase (KDO 8-P phosphatase)|nr:HAD hydrolase family protein [Bacteroidales bacterium]
MHNYREKLQRITTFILDFDGVLSDGKIWVLPDGEQMRATNVKDGYAMQYALRKGYRIAIISGGIGDSMRLRYQNFKGIEVFLKVSDKVAVFQEYIDKYNLNREEVLYMGDDIPDYELMKICGLKCCPADACTEIKEIADYISFAVGGQGCVRDVIEQTLRAQNRWMENDACIW